MKKIERMSFRIQRLLDARAKCLLKVKDGAGIIQELTARASLDKDDPDFADDLVVQAGTTKQLLKDRATTRKVAQYDASLANFQKYGQEEVPTGNPVGVDINVPKGTFKITDHAPVTDQAPKEG